MSDRPDPKAFAPVVAPPAAAAPSSATFVVQPAVFNEFTLPVAPADESPAEDAIVAAVIHDLKQHDALVNARTQIYTDISGTAGTGKTFTARMIVEASAPGTVILAATTGIAAVNLGEGTTINAVLKYFDIAQLRANYVAGHLQATLRKLRRAGVRRILLDEKSMLSGQALSYIAKGIREVNEGEIAALESVGAGDDYDISRQEEMDLPPIGLTLIGDFGQLPPVPDTDDKGKKLPVEFAFDSPQWELFKDHRTILDKIYRQDAQDFIAALHAVRRGDAKKALEFFTPDKFSQGMANDFDGTTIFAKNDEVDRFNIDRLEQLKTPKVTFTTIRTGTQRSEWKRMIPDELVLKEGALVMLLANRREPRLDAHDDTAGAIVYANGDLATLLGAGDKGWFVRLHRNGQEVRVLPQPRDNVIPLEAGRLAELKALGTADTAVKDKKFEIIGSVLYMPLRAAYGCTVHKTQGLTLDKVQVNISDYFMKQPGMQFVALSRARSAEGLRIVGSQRAFVERCTVERRVQPWL